MAVRALGKRRLARGLTLIDAQALERIDDASALVKSEVLSTPHGVRSARQPLLRSVRRIHQGCPGQRQRISRE
jgi:hypothetical protein